jgi:hypothetical protein
MGSGKGGAEVIWHIAGVRLRIVGSGNLQMYLRTLDNTRSFTMLPLPMAATTDKEPTRLGNIRSQRTQVEFRVTEQDEWFRISKLVVFAKVSGTSLPG